MDTIGALLRRDLRRKIEEIIQVDQADEQSVHEEITEYIATDIFVTSTPRSSKPLPTPLQTRTRELASGFRASLVLGKARSPQTSAMPYSTTKR